MKLKIRIIPLVVVAFLVFSCALPASANDFIDTIYDAYWINLLDYTQVFESGNYGMPPVGVSDIRIDMPYTCTVGLLDMVVGCYSSNVELYLVHPRDGAIKLNKIPITGYGDKLYRFYVEFGVWDFSELTIRCDSGTEYTWLDFHSVRISSKGAISSFTPLNGTAVWGTGSKELAKDPHNMNPAYVNIPVQSMSNNDFSLTLFVPEWKEYDFVDFQLSLDCLSVSSIVANFDGSTVPIEVSYLDNTAMGGDYYINITVDMRNLFRGVSGSPTITITGKLYMDSGNYISLQDCRGFVLLDTTDSLYYRFKSVTDALKQQTQDIVSAISTQISPLVSWLTNVRDSVVTWGSNIASTVSTWGQNIVTAINPDPGSGEDAKNQGSSIGNQFNDLNDQMNSLQKPDLENAGSVSNIISNSDLISSTQFLTTVVNAPYISSVMTLALVLSLAGYVLFGKR